MELVAVITLLAILAAFALPRLLNLGTSGRVAVINNFAGSLQSAVTVVHGACVATPGCMSNVVEERILPLDGKTTDLWGNYPNGGTPLGVASVDTVIDSSGFDVSAAGPNGWTMTTFRLASAPDPANCSVTYTEVVTLDVPPVIKTVTTGC